MVSKIANYVPQPQSAMLVADEDPLNIFGFATTNDVSKLRRPEAPCSDSNRALPLELLPSRDQG